MRVDFRIVSVFCLLGAIVDTFLASGLFSHCFPREGGPRILRSVFRPRSTEIWICRTCSLFPAFSRSVLWFASGVQAIRIFPGAVFGKCFRIVGVARFGSGHTFTCELWTLLFETLLSGSYLFVFFRRESGFRTPGYPGDDFWKRLRVRLISTRFGVVWETTFGCFRISVQFVLRQWILAHTSVPEVSQTKSENVTNEVSASFHKSLSND